MGKSDRVLVLQLYRSLRRHNYKRNAARNMIGLLLGVGERKYIWRIPIIFVTLERGTNGKESASRDQRDLAATDR